MSAVRFSSLPMKNSGLGTHYGILTLQAKLSVLRSRVPYVLAKAFCSHSPNSCSDKGDLWLLQPGCQQKYCFSLGSETNWGSWMRNLPPETGDTVPGGSYYPSITA